jgi:hypothetical protein
MRTPTLLITLALLLAILLPACNIAGPIVAVVAGPEGGRAEYEPPRDRVATIFIDDRNNRAPTRSVRELIGLTAERTLLNKGAIKDMVQSRLVLSTLRSERMGRPMTIAEVGQAVQAEVVIYATIDQWALTPDGQTFAPQADLRVKVIDAKADTRLWPGPDDPRGTEVTLSVRVPAQAKVAPTSTSGVAEAHRELARWVGLRLAQMFCDHSPSDVPGRFDVQDRSRD